MKSLFDKFSSLGLGIRVIALTLMIIKAIVAVNTRAFINKYRSAANQEVSRNIEQIASVTRQTSEGTNQAAATQLISQRAEKPQQRVGQC